MAKLQAGKLGAFGFKPQVTVGTDPGVVTFYWMRGTVAEFAPQQQVQDLGALIGGSLLPEGQVKTGIFSGGRFVAPPFLDDYFGWFLKTFSGTSASAAHGDAGNKLYKHYFPSNVLPDSTYPENVLCIHKITPTDETYDMGEQFLDCMVSRMQFGFTGGDFVTWSGEFLGKRPVKENATGTDWTVSGLKCKDSVPITALPLTTALQFPIGSNIEGGQAVTLDIRNITPGYRDVAVLGSYDPHSWPVLNRSIMVTVRMLFHTDDLYSLAFYDGAGVWNPEIMTSSFQVTSQSAAFIDSDVYSPTPGAMTLNALYFTDATGDFSAYDDAADFGYSLDPGVGFGWQPDCQGVLRGPEWWEHLNQGVQGPWHHDRGVDPGWHRDTGHLPALALRPVRTGLHRPERHLDGNPAHSRRQ